MWLCLVLLTSEAHVQKLINGSCSIRVSLRCCFVVSIAVSVLSLPTVFSHPASEQHMQAVVNSTCFTIHETEIS